MSQHPLHLLRPLARTFSTAQTSSSFIPSAILSTALKEQVPTHGFTRTSLLHATRACGYGDIAASALFPRGAFELVLHHLATQRQNLSQSAGSTTKELVRARLQGNVDAGVVGRLSEALAIMSLAENIPASVTELTKLADEIVFRSGDTAVDTRWYLRRAGVAGVYASTELFMSTDTSHAYRDTWGFLDRRVRDLESVWGAAGDVGGYLGFTAAAAGNVLRSKGIWFY